MSTVQLTILNTWMLKEGGLVKKINLSTDFSILYSQTTTVLLTKSLVNSNAIVYFNTFWEF